MKKFFAALGNPPYQRPQESQDIETSKKNFAPPIYDAFMDAAFEVADCVELIHPARFLFNAGSTQKSWNEKMLSDPHFKVMSYEPDSAKVFPNLSTPIKGGIAITYRDESKDYGAIEVFAEFPEANTVTHKVISSTGFESLSNIVYSRTSYRLNESMHKDFPQARYKEDDFGNNVGLLSKGHDYDMASNIFDRLPMVFFDTPPADGHDYVRIIGRDGNKRIYKFIKRLYINDVANMEYYKVLVPQANGNGRFGEAISEPIIEGPHTGSTETFISFGAYQTKDEALATAKYLKTKFARMLLSMLKVTQNGNKPVWRLIPLQNFTPSSDIDWSKTIPEIDQQLYKKYGLSPEEIEFIETHVKEMK